ncbi:MAG: 2-phospho-L-lactate guanylyltransferase, partial [Actinomycetota bacterium]|nr:2-phospho-L-lactate guanylyltransferase [Actinomycetota bacterium]
MDQGTGWTVVLPVKGLEQAKRRLAPDVGRWRMSLAAAFAADVVEAALAVGDVSQVIVVGGEGVGAWAQPRVTQLPDADDLDAAVARGADRARDESPYGAILVVQADLPCLRASDLENLAAAAPAARPGVLADAEGFGTVALTLPAGTTLCTTFGVGSFARHVRAGAEPIDLDAPRLRRDVDT